MTDKELEAFLEMGRKYKNVFSSMEGQAVLKDIVWNLLGTFNTKKTSEGDIALSNAGAVILNYVACEDPNLTVERIVRAIIGELPEPIKQEEE